jgi:DNA-binding Lrp family transcriptional regulator
LDKLDVKLIRGFLQAQRDHPIPGEIRLPYSSLAHQLGISESTARDRLRRIQRSGFVAKWSLLVNPSLLGVHLFALGFDMPTSVPRDDVVEKLKLLPEVLLLVSYHGGHVGVLFYHRDEADLTKQIRLISKLSSMQDSYTTKIPFPPCEISLSRTDWRIISSLQTDTGRSYREIATGLNISTRTVKRRLARMVAYKAIFAIATGDFNKLTEAVRADFIVHYSTEARSASEPFVIGALNEYLIFAAPWQDFSVYNTMVPNIPQAKKLYHLIRQHAGVKNVRLGLAEEQHEAYEILKEQVDRRLAQMQVTRVRKVSS